MNMVDMCLLSWLFIIKGCIQLVYMSVVNTTILESKGSKYDLNDSGGVRETLRMVLNRDYSVDLSDLLVLFDILTLCNLCQ